MASLKSASADTVEQAAEKLGDLATDKGMREPIVAAGALTPLVALLQHPSAGAAEKAAWVLCRLADRSDERKCQVNALDAASSLQPLLSHPDSGLAHRAGLALKELGH